LRIKDFETLSIDDVSDEPLTVMHVELDPGSGRITLELAELAVLSRLDAEIRLLGL
jgi:hypothetical protein